MRVFPKPLSESGITFIEIILSLFILTVALLGFSQVLATAQSAGKRANHFIIASNLAAGLMAEIMSKDFEEAGAPGSFEREEGDNRYEFDDVDDYDDWTESPPKTAGTASGGGYLDMDGTSGTPSYPQFTRDAKISFVEIVEDTPGEYSINDVADTSPTDYKRVTVTVGSPFGKDVSITALKVKK